MADVGVEVGHGLVVVGELCVDLIVGLRDDEIRFGQHEQWVEFTELTMGSSSAITACGASTLGVPTSMVGVVGQDLFGNYVLNELARRGVDTRHMRVDASLPTGSSTHLSRPDGDRAILTAPGSIGQTTLADVPSGALAAAAHLHLGSYFLQRGLWGQAPQMFRRARAAGVGTSIDGNFDPVQEWDRGILEVIAHADVFFANEQELTGITGMSDPDSAVDALLAQMPPGAMIVHKRGSDGASCAWRPSGNGETARVHARPPDVPGRLVDTVGAGDSLAAGFLHGRLRGLAVEHCLALGVACGSASTRAAGGVAGQPTRALAEELADEVAIRS